MWYGNVLREYDQGKALGDYLSLEVSRTGSYSLPKAVLLEY